jgi:hypothetical protein
MAMTLAVRLRELTQSTALRLIMYGTPFKVIMGR